MALKSEERGVGKKCLPLVRDECAQTPTFLVCGMRRGAIERLHCMCMFERIDDGMKYRVSKRPGLALRIYTSRTEPRG